ncbi:uncharacterized protein LOC112202104 isoform X2 [Rosa chinensis]|uniref:uncharacterized protein LOC112202104 isoform X2 n=1 Tax=Rosa chinensis TaxID=74649 RepID=UPI001AD8E678|nr:uncharacterized protein LOC112202104 isoform X2 [Rosa chinensis]
MDIILAFATPLTEWTVKPIGRQLSYVFNYKSNIEDLTRQVRELRLKRDGVDLEVKPAREALKTIDPGVDGWLGDVDKIIKEKETSFSEETVAAKVACCNGWLPNLKSRYSLGRKAKKMTQKADKLLATEPKTIAHPASHPEVEFRPTVDFHEGGSSSGTSTQEQPPTSEGKNINFDSRRSTIRDVMEVLKGNQINPIIICGMGGIGKTTLMGQIFEKAKEECMFDEYTKATIKESLDKAPGMIQIQDELAEYLGLILEVKERAPRASMLRQRLSQGSKKILVMLDNVSTTTQDFLWNIGIPPSCKLLVTSRQQDLFKDMDTRMNFPIHGLPETDAWSLFKKTAGSTIESDLELQVVAKKVLKECAGLPIAISTVGTALKGESIAIWKNALRELEKASPENVPGVIEHVYSKIKFSYECLRNEQAKSCFLLCCIFEESVDIWIEDLVTYGLGLGLFKGIDSIVEGRNCVETLVQTLKSRFLLLDSDNELECVRMHDVVHDVAVHIASEEFVEKKKDAVEKRIVVRDKAETVKLIDWPKNVEEPTYCSSLSISGLCQLLLLRHESTRECKPPPTIFNKMEDLKVLVFMRTLPPFSPQASLAVLKDLQTLRLESHNLPDDVSVIGELRKLMILSLRETNVKQLPDTFKNLSNLRLLDLFRCKELEIISPGVISSLCLLEELYMWSSFEDWVVEKLASTETANWISQLEAQDRAASKEVEHWEMTMDTWKRFNKLAVEQPANLGKQFREEVQGLLRVNDEQTRWANSMDWKTGILAELLSLSHLSTLEVFLPPVNEIVTSNLFNKLERFKISIGWKHPMYDWELKHADNYLGVHDLDASAAVGSGITLLLKKTSILEFRMKNLTKPQALNVLDTDQYHFAKMKSLTLKECDAVEYLIDRTLSKHNTPHSSNGLFPVLNSLVISGASRLKMIFNGELPTGSLKELKHLELNCLPALTYIWKTKSQSELGLWRNILGPVQVLRIQYCSSLEKIFAYEDDEEVLNFQSLTELTLSDLPSFTGISKNISKGSKRLPEDISPELSDVIIQPLFDTKVHFPALTKLYIKSMNLTEIWNSQLSAESFCELRVSECQLKSLWVSECHKLLRLVPAYMQNRLQKLEYIWAWHCSSLEEIFEFRRLTVDDAGDAAALTISESGSQGTQMNKMLSFKQSGQAFQNLRQISILFCESLRTLLSPSIARGLVKLQMLMIRNCKKIEEVVATAAEGEETNDDTLFPQLCTLTLDDLPNLRSFSQGSEHRCQRCR